MNASQKEAIEELFNIGLGRAAMTLSHVANAEVMLSASDMQLSNINTGQALDTIKSASEGNWISISQTVSGEIDAVSLVLFSDENAMKIVQSVLGGEMQDIHNDYEPEVMVEIANIILNACISAIASMMHLKIESYLPVHHIGDGESVLLDSPVLPMKLLIRLEMIVSSKVASGFISFSVNQASLQQMLQRIEQYLESEVFEWLS